MSNVKETVDKLPSLFNPARAKGYNRVIQLKITGEGGGDFWVEIKSQQITVTPGAAPNAKFTLEMSAEDFISYFAGAVHPMDLVRGGKMKFTGPMTEGIAFNAIWNIPKK